MTPQQFIQNTSGRAVTYDGLQVNYGQCEQLVCLFWKDVYGFTTPSIPYAKDLITNPTVLAKFSVIPVGQEQPWDVAVFGASTVINSPVAGHTDIVIAPGSNGFTGWDSNWGGVTDQNKGTPGYGYPAAHQVTHTHNDVLGFLRYNGGNMNPPDPNQINQLVTLCWGPGNATQADIAKLNSQATIQDALNLILGDNRTAAWDKEVYALQAGNKPATKLSPGLYEV